MYFIDYFIYEVMTYIFIDKCVVMSKNTHNILFKFSYRSRYTFCDDAYRIQG